MGTVTLTKKEYEKLVDAKLRYEYLRHIFEGNIFSPPPLRKAAEVVKALRATKRYPKDFLKSVAGGLKRSSYFNA